MIAHASDPPNGPQGCAIGKIAIIAETSTFQKPVNPRHWFKPIELKATGDGASRARVGRGIIDMPTLLRIGAFEIRIYLNDHPPAHVHVVKDRAQAMIALDPVVFVRISRMTKNDAAQAKRIVWEHRNFLLEAWRKFHDG